jgi:hypothetical protein
MRPFALAFLLLFVPICIKADGVRLQYLPETPVQLTSKLAVEVQESMPILNLATKGHQVSRSPITHLPLLLNLTLKDIFVFLNVNGEELSYDPRGEKVSVPLVQFSLLIDKPMEFKVDERGYLVDEAGTLGKIFKQQPALKNISLPLLLNEMLFHLFALSGEDLFVGAKFERAAQEDPSGVLAPVIFYEIIEVNDQEVMAKVKGTVKPKTMQFSTILTSENKSPQKVEMKLTGDLQGNISWKRNNALQYSLNNTYNYLAELKFGEMRWTIQMTITHHSVSAAL